MSYGLYVLAAYSITGVGLALLVWRSWRFYKKYHSPRDDQ